MGPALAAAVTAVGVALAISGVLALLIPAPFALLVTGLSLAALGLFGIDIERRPQ